MSYGLGFMIESLVATLLVITIGYCLVLNHRLKRMRADEQSLKATISELITATEIAQRAVAGLKATAHECENTLGERLRAAERCCETLRRHVKSGEVIADRLNRGATLGSPENALAPADAPDPKMLAATARALAERTRERVSTLAA